MTAPSSTASPFTSARVRAAAQSPSAAKSAYRTVRFA